LKIIKKGKALCIESMPIEKYFKDHLYTYEIERWYLNPNGLITKVTNKEGRLYWFGEEKFKKYFRGFI